MSRDTCKQKRNSTQYTQAEHTYVNKQYEPLREYQSQGNQKYPGTENLSPYATHPTKLWLGLGLGTKATVYGKIEPV